MRRRDAAVVEIARDLAKGPPCLPRGSNVVDDFGRDALRASPFHFLCPRSSRSSLFGDESLELVDRDERRPPRHLDRLDQRKDAAVECRPAYAKRLGGLRARVGEPLNARRFSNDLAGRGSVGGGVAASSLASVPQATARHSYNVHKSCTTFAPGCIL